MKKKGTSLQKVSKLYDAAIRTKSNGNAPTHMV